jgi:hypothetical protein
MLGTDIFLLLDRHAIFGGGQQSRKTAGPPVLESEPSPLLAEEETEGEPLCLDYNP